jgi:hypothetical protein
MPLVHTKVLRKIGIKAIGSQGQWRRWTRWNAAAPVAGLAGEEVVEARELTNDRFAAGVGAEGRPAG